jgi:hypothetical protein
LGTARLAGGDLNLPRSFAKVIIEGLLLGYGHDVSMDNKKYLQINSVEDGRRRRSRGARAPSRGA